MQIVYHFILYFFMNIDVFLFLKFSIKNLFKEK